jgi:predicted Zn-dependent protease
MSPAATSALSRRQCCVGLVALLGGLGAQGCLTVSPQEERKLGRDEAQEVEKTVGLVRDRRLVEYMTSIGARLERAAGRADISWQWSIADDPELNAFALPGGWVYVTRGLLALSNREDELAGVLAHEMAHVIERHAVKRVGAATPLAVLFGVPSGILGMVSPSLGGIVGGAGRVVSGLALAPYSREQELDADRIGVGLAARAGWDPTALGGLLGTLERAEALSGSAAKRSFFATHPSTPDRVAKIDAVAGSLSRAPVAPITGSRAAFLGRLDGLAIGNNAANGVFLGQLFLHPDFDVALAMPASWKTGNSPEAAGAIAPGESAVVFLHVVGDGNDPMTGAKADGLTDPQLERIRRFQISQLPAAALSARTRHGTYVALTWIAHRSRIFRVTGVCGGADWERYRPDFERTAASFRPLRQDEAARIAQSRLRIRTARAGESIAEVLARGGATWSPAQAALANGVAPGRRLERDWPVKVAISERYRPE